MSIQADDLKLMQRVAAGDEAGIDQLYSRFAPLVFKASRQVLSSNAEAEDAVQDTWFRWEVSGRSKNIESLVRVIDGPLPGVPSPVMSARCHPSSPEQGCLG